MKNALINNTFAALGIASLVLMAGGAQADWHHEGRGGPAIEQSRVLVQQIDARQQQQMERIHHGRHQGSLTRYEFRDLMHEQQEIRVMEHHFLADGLIDAREFRRLNRALDISSHNIRKQMHDDQARYADNRWFD